MNKVTQSLHPDIQIETVPVDLEPLTVGQESESQVLCANVRNSVGSAQMEDVLVPSYVRIVGHVL